MDKSNYIPQYLDESERFLFWTLDEAMSLFIPLVLGAMVSVGLGVLIGVVTMLLYRKIKNMGAGVRSIKGYCYWNLPLRLTPIRKLPPSYLREFIG